MADTAAAFGNDVKNLVTLIEKKNEFAYIVSEISESSWVFE